NSTLVAPLATVPNDIEFAPYDVLFGENGQSPNNTLVRIDAQTGAMSVLGTDGTVFQVTALETDPNPASPTYRKLFAATVDSSAANRMSSLAMIDPNTGAITVIGSTNIGEI